MRDKRPRRSYGLSSSEGISKEEQNMRMFLIVAVLALVATSNQVSAASSLGFDCGDHDPNLCTCKGPIDSQDCRGMKKNCSGDITCGGVLGRCRCKYVPPAIMGGTSIHKGTIGGTVHAKPRSQ